MRRTSAARHTDTMSDWIVSDPETLGGKPRIRGTRISVEHVLELVASGATRDEVIRAYPHLTIEGFQAALDFASRAVREQAMWDLKISA